MKLTTVSILWQGKPISKMKTFGRLNCVLCMKEKLEIIKANNVDKNLKLRKLVNSSNEIYGACRHWPKFHRFAISQTSSTDVGLTISKRSETQKLYDLPICSYPELNHTETPVCDPCCLLIEENNDCFAIDL